MNSLVKSQTPNQPGFAALYEDSDTFQRALKMADYLAKSELVPKNFQGRPANILIALQKSSVLGIDPIELMSGLYISPAGRPTLETKTAISLLNLSGEIVGPLTYDIKGKGQDMLVTAMAQCKKTEKQLTASISMKEVTAAGWTRNKQTWVGNQEQMLCYKAAISLIRRYFPHVLGGMSTKQELDIIEVKQEKTPEIIKKMTAHTEMTNA